MIFNKKIVAPVAVLVLLAVIAGAGFFWYNGQSATAIHISGNIELTEIKIGFKVAGRLEALLVDEGDPVAKGAVVARLDSEQFGHQRDAALATLAAADAGLAQLHTTIDLQRELVESQIEVSQADQNQAQAQLDKLLAGSRTQEVAQARAAVQEAQAQLDKARRDWQRAQELYQSNTISTAQYDQARTQFEATQALHNRAVEQRALVIEGPRKEDIATARAGLAKAQAGMRAAQAGRLELERLQQELTVRQAEVDRARAQVALTQSQVADTLAVSPIDGMVLVKAAESGEILAPGTTVLTIGDLAHPWLRAYINEPDLGKVNLGQPVQVTTDSFPGKIYQGHITYIASQAEFTPKQIQTKEERVKLVYRIKIEIDNPEQELKLNMPVDAVIEVQG